jgi:D-alanyl-D-alanine carboxypeptidase
MVNINDYSRNAAQKGWGAGWPSCSGARGTLATVSADRSGVRLTVHSRIARLVDLLIDATENRGYLGKPGQCGAYNCRPIGGTRTASNHSWGLAVDWNWQDNPYTSSGRNSIPGWMPPLWNRYGFAWGGNYRGSKKDYMHFEFMGSPGEADQMTGLAARELGGGAGPPAPAPAPATGPAGLPSLEIGQSGPAIASLQRFCNAFNWVPALPLLRVDGDYGPKTADVLRRAQLQMGVRGGDGRNVGPQTKAALWARGWRG